MHSYIRPNTYIVLRLPSGILKVLEIIPNTTINIGKFGAFPANLLLGRPYYLTFELLDKEEGKDRTELRVVPAPELHAEALNSSDHATPAESRDEPFENDGGTEFDIVGEDGRVIMRSNRMTVDDPSRQTLSMEEIEELKKAGAGSGKEIIAKIMASHMAIDEKTSFSLAKYTLRKSKKYLRRFTVFPLDVGLLTEYITERGAHKIMEVREEMLGLIGSWANVHYGTSSEGVPSEDGKVSVGGGRWLVVDDTGGLVVAALSEKMGILYPQDDSEEEEEGQEFEQVWEQDEAQGSETLESKQKGAISAHSYAQAAQDAAVTGADTSPSSGAGELSTNQSVDAVAAKDDEPSNSNSQLNPSQAPQTSRKSRVHIPAMSAPTNTLTVLHSNTQPNLGLLKYFSFDSAAPAPSHPLYTHLKSLSWLQLLYPQEDPSCIEPELVADSVLCTWKSNRKGAYYRKRRRWERITRVVEETRAGGFDGLVVASVIEPATVLRELVPLVRGGGQIAVYKHDVESLVELCDFYSKERRAAFLARQSATKPDQETNSKQEQSVNGEQQSNGGSGEDELDPSFPVNPTLLLAPMLQTARARHWQVLPGRTHPLMTSKGGAEGYLFTATRVLPVEGKVEARGKYRGKKRKTGPESSTPT